MRPYSDDGSSGLAAKSEPKTRPRPPAGSPFTVYGLRLSNEPSAKPRRVPTLGDVGFTQSKCVKPAGYFGSPMSDSAWWRLFAAGASVVAAGGGLLGGGGGGGRGAPGGRV